MHHFGLVVLGVLAIVAWILLGGSSAVYLVVALTGSLLGIVIGLWIDHRMSTGARTNRAVRAGRIGEALRLLEHSPAALEIDQLLAESLSSWPAAHRALHRAVRELDELQNAIVRGRAAGIDAEIAKRVIQATQTAAVVLYRSADRLGAAAIQHVDLEEIGAGVDREVTRIDHLTTSVHAARIGLAELTLSGGRNIEARTQEETVIVRLMALGEAARELAEMNNQGTIADDR